MKASAAHAAAVVLLVATAGAFTTAQAQVDFTGQWAPLYQEDTIERVPARSLVTTRACRSPRPGGFARQLGRRSHLGRPGVSVSAHSADYGLRGLAPIRVWAEYDDATQRIVAFNVHIGAYDETRERFTSTVVRIRPTMQRTRFRDFRQASGKATR
jgi:hypothetical protein